MLPRDSKTDAWQLDADLESFSDIFLLEKQNDWLYYVVKGLKVSDQSFNVSSISSHEMNSTIAIQLMHEFDRRLKTTFQDLEPTGSKTSE